VPEIPDPLANPIGSTVQYQGPMEAISDAVLRST
jgi:hypothetical protein